MSRIRNPRTPAQGLVKGRNGHLVINHWSLVNTNSLLVNRQSAERRIQPGIRRRPLLPGVIGFRFSGRGIRPSVPGNRTGPRHLMFRFYREFCAARESANAWHKHRRSACGDPKTIQGRRYLIRSDHMQTLLAVGAGSLQPAGSTVDRAIIASFDQHVRLERSDQLFGCRLVEDHDDVDAGQAGQQAGAVFLIDHRQGSPV
jgi:hypothetical protein